MWEQATVHCINRLWTSASGTQECCLGAPAPGPGQLVLAEPESIYSRGPLPMWKIQNWPWATWEVVLSHVGDDMERDNLGRGGLAKELPSPKLLMCLHLVALWSMMSEVCGLSTNRLESNAHKAD